MAASLAANWPGHYSVDSVSQLAQGRDGLFDDWHPPIMAWLLGLADRLTPHAVAFIVADALLFFGSLTIFAVAEPRPRLMGALAMAVAAISPQALVFQGMVWKDILFADATIGGFAALALAGRFWPSRMVRAGWLGGSLALFLLATLTRQAGLVAALAGAGTFIAIALVNARSPRRAVARIVSAAAGALVLVALLAAAISFAFTLRNDGEPGASVELAMLQTFDLAGAAHIDPHVTMPAMRQADPALEWFMRSQAGPRFRPGTQDYLDDLPAADVLLPPRGEVVARDWRRLISRRPWLYIQARARVFWTTLATPASQSCPVISVGVQTDDTSALVHAGLVPRKTAKDEWDEAYVLGFVGTPVLSHLVWGALALWLLIMGVWDVALGEDRRPASLAVIGLLIAAFAFVATFFVAAVACDYRYLYLLDAAALVAAVRRVCARPT
jgi:hypothetical protein